MSKATKKSARKAAPKKRAAAKKAAVKKVVAKQKAERAAAKPVKAEIVVRVDTSPVKPTETDLAEPIREGKSLTIPKTWMSEHQLTFMMQKTPRDQVYRRKGKGGKEFDYVTGSYITKALNYAFGWNWDFEVLEHGKEGDHVWVLGRLTVRNPADTQTITKTQFGRSDVKQLTSGKGNVDYGNDLKAASTDALKKCASMLGFASDVYGKTEYTQESGQAPLPPADPRYPAPTEHEPVIAPGAPSPAIEDHVCQYLGKGGCGRDLTKQEAAYSKRLYGRELCREHYPKK